MSEEREATARGRRIVEAIVEAGRRMGLDVVEEHPVPGGRIDVAWLWRPNDPLPGDIGPLILAAFEVESSWRSRKHVKGSYLNLIDLGPALGVIVLAGEGGEIDSLRRFAERLVARPGLRVMIWSERDVEALRQPDLSALEGLPVEVQAPEVDRPGAVREHAGKYRALWQWLRRQDARELTLTFREVEEVLGAPLPPSSRQHLPHWYS